MKNLLTFLFITLFAAFSAIAEAPNGKLLLRKPNTSREYIYVPVIGQSNASEMYFHHPGTTRSSLMTLEHRLGTLTGKNIVTTFNRRALVIPTVNGSSIDGDYATGGNDRIWWYPNSKRPGGALTKAVGIMQKELQQLQRSGQVTKMGIIWWQGENGAWSIGGGGNTQKVRTQRYKQALIDVFAYLRGVFGSQVDIYMVQIAPIAEGAARNSGQSTTEIANIQNGVRIVQRIQQEVARAYPDVHIAAQTSDLQTAFDAAKEHGQADPWHLAHASYDVVAKRLAEYIARDRP